MHITRGTGRAGIERKIISLTDALSGRFEFGHLGLFDRGHLDQAFAERGLPSYFAGIRELPLMAYPFYFTRRGLVSGIVREFGADLVHIYHPPHHWWLGSAAKDAGAAVVLEACNANRYCRKRLAALVERRGFRYIDRAIAISRFVQNRYQEAFGVSPENFEVIHNGTDTKLFRPPKEGECREIRSELGIAEDATVICGSGRFIPRKGFHILLESLTLLPKSADFVLLLAGDGPERERLESMAESAGIRAFFPGFRQDIHRILRAADIYVCPSLHEEFGQVLTEGMATGLACVASETGGFLEIASGGEDSLTFESGNPGALAEKITLLLDDRELREKLGEKAREKAVSQFGLDRMIEKKASLYERLIS